jgi:aspartate ammonia-lyase
MNDYRIEKDFLGETKVPCSALYGSFTARALENFNISGIKIGLEFTQALAIVKQASARANNKVELLDDSRAEAIVEAAKEVIDGKHWDAFPLDVFQAGAGTPWNMNMNEVLANRANQLLGSSFGRYNPVHPNDHVNMSQSSNDVIPTATRIMILNLSKELRAELSRLESTLSGKSKQFRNLIKSGRTHYRDAVPITLGQEFRGYASAIKHGSERLIQVENELKGIVVGGTAVGTGINTRPEFAKVCLSYIKELTNLDLSLAPDYIEKTQFTSDFLGYFDGLTELCSDLIKINNDLMLLSSGPMTGLNEIALPSVEPGSSIMPGKVNPSIIESVNMVCLQVIGVRESVANAVRFGSLDLNVYLPLIAFNADNSLHWLTAAVKNLNDKCIAGISAEKETLSHYYLYSNAFVTAISPIIGYDKAAELAREAGAQGKTVAELLVERKMLSLKELQELEKVVTGPDIEFIEKMRRMHEKASRKSGAMS